MIHFSNPYDSIATYVSFCIIDLAGEDRAKFVKIYIPAGDYADWRSVVGG